MPTIQVEIATITKEKKKEIIERVTETMSEVTNIPKQSFSVYINEHDPDNIGVGGVSLTELRKK